MAKKKKTKTIPLPEFSMFPAEVYGKLTPKEIVTHIEYNFRVADLYLKKTGKRKADLREVLVRWGIWSRRMNVILRARINQNIPQAILLHKNDPKENAEQEKKVQSFQHNIVHLKLAYSYWWNRAQTLEQYRKSFFGRIADRKALEIGKHTLTTMIESNASLPMIKEKAPKFWSLVERLSQKKELTAEETESVLNGGPGPVNDIES